MNKLEMNKLETEYQCYNLEVADGIRNYVVTTHQ